MLRTCTTPLNHHFFLHTNGERKNVKIHFLLCIFTNKTVMSYFIKTCKAARSDGVNNVIILMSVIM